MLIVFTTAPSMEEARKLARLAVDRKLAACVQIVPAIESVYEWKGKIEAENESLMLFKTKDSRYGELEAFLEKEHSYETPEIVAVRSERISAGYAKWLNDIVK